MLVVIDTNILVSALWSRDGAPARVVGLVLSGHLIPCYDHRIMLEYRQVLQRPKFRFRPAEVNALLDWVKLTGRSVVPTQVEVPFVDEADRKFYEVAKYCGAVLITGNLKHYPSDETVMSVSGFLEQNRWAATQ